MAKRQTRHEAEVEGAAFKSVRYLMRGAPLMHSRPYRLPRRPAQTTKRHALRTWSGGNRKGSVLDCIRCWRADLGDWASWHSAGHGTMPDDRQTEAPRCVKQLCMPAVGGSRYCACARDRRRQPVREGKPARRRRRTLLESGQRRIAQVRAGVMTAARVCGDRRTHFAVEDAPVRQVACMTRPASGGQGAAIDPQNRPARL